MPLLQGLLTSSPKVSVGGQAFRGSFDEDIGSTLLFDRRALKRMAETEELEAKELTLQPADTEHPLVCITTKRLRCYDATQPGSAIGKG
jgi:hypothetical protein